MEVAIQEEVKQVLASYEQQIVEVVIEAWDDFISDSVNSKYGARSRANMVWDNMKEGAKAQWDGDGNGLPPPWEHLGFGSHRTTNKWQSQDSARQKYTRREGLVMTTEARAKFFQKKGNHDVRRPKEQAGLED